MAQKSKAASLTPDLLTSKSVPTQPALRKQSTNLSLAPPTKDSRPEPAKAAAPQSAKAKTKAKDAEPAGELDIARKPGSEDASGATARTDAAPKAPPSSAAAPPSSAAAVTEAEPTEPNGGDTKALGVDERPKAEADSDYRIRIPVPLDPSEHLELTLAAARSGRSCQEIIVEALFRYLEDIAGPPDRPAAPGPEGHR